MVQRFSSDAMFIGPSLDIYSNKGLATVYRCQALVRYRIHFTGLYWPRLYTSHEDFKALTLLLHL